MVKQCVLQTSGPEISGAALCGEAPIKGPTSPLACPVLLGLLMCVVLFMGYRCLNSPYFLDDLQEAARVRSFQSWTECFQPDSFSFFRPVKNLLFYIVGASWQRGHWLSLLLYGLSMMVLYWAYCLWFGHRLWAFVAVGVWALAPTQVSALVWLSCANILICGACAVSALCCYATSVLHARRGKDVTALTLGLACGLSYAGGLLAYEGAIVLPLLMVLVGATRLRHLGWRLSRWPALIVGLVTIAYGLLRWSLVPAGTEHGPGLHVTADWQLSLASAYITLDHLWSWIAPFGRQEILGTFVWGRTVGWTPLGAAWLILLGLGLLAYRLRHVQKDASFGLLWFLITFLPMSNLFAFRNGPFADYYLVLPGMGLALGVTGVLRGLARGLAGGRQAALRPAVMASLLLILVAWRGAGAVTMVRWSERWKDPEQLFAVSLSVRPLPFRARGNLAMAWAKRGRLDRAEPLIAQCIEEAPWFALGHSMLGRLREAQRDIDAARVAYGRALALDAREPFALRALTRLGQRAGTRSDLESHALTGNR